MMSAPALAKAGISPVGILHHQVYVEGHAGQRTDPLNDGRPKLRLGTKTPSMTSRWTMSAPGAFHKSDFVSQMGEITR